MLMVAAVLRPVSLSVSAPVVPLIVIELILLSAMRPERPESTLATLSVDRERFDLRHRLQPLSRDDRGAADRGRRPDVVGGDRVAGGEQRAEAHFEGRIPGLALLGPPRIADLHHARRRVVAVDRHRVVGDQRRLSARIRRAGHRAQHEVVSDRQIGGERRKHGGGAQAGGRFLPLERLIVGA